MNQSPESDDASVNTTPRSGGGLAWIAREVKGLLRRRKLTRRYKRMIAALQASNPSVFDIECARAGFRPWLKSKMYSKGPLIDGLPWLPFSAIEKLESHLTASSRVFVYGAGGSTIFFSSRVAELVSVEHDRNWYVATQKAMEPRAKRKGFQWTGLFVEPRKLSSEALFAAPEDPHGYSSSSGAFKQHCFRDYVSTINAYADAYFDVILIDGRSRPSCFLHAMSKVRPGGVIVLDNAERPSYGAVEQLAQGSGFQVSEVWGPGPYNDYCWRTIFLQRPTI